MKKGLSIVINIILFAIILLLGWQVVKSIMAPIKFSTEQEAREAKVVERLIDIRNAEVLYKNVNNRFTADFDSLINFCKTSEVPNIVMLSVFNPADSTYSTEYDTLPGIPVVKYLDSISKIDNNRADTLNKEKERLIPFDVDQLKFVPGAPNNELFEIEASTISRNGIEIPVFEVRTPYDVYLATPSDAFTKEKWEERVRNAKAEKENLERYAGLKVGSLTEATTDGNWQKL